MNLEEFVSATLVSIAKGISSAARLVAEQGGSVNPSDVEYEAPAGPAYGSKTAVGIPREIEFDVAVTTSDEDKSGLGGGLSALKVFSASATQSTQTANSVVSRVKFSVPMILPAHDRKRRN